MIKIEFATEQVLDNFQYDGIEKEMLNTVDWRRQLAVYYDIGRVWQVMNDMNTVIMLYGLFEISKGVEQAWMLFNKSAAFYAKAIAKEIREHLKRELKEYHRVQTFVYTDDKAARYVELFGFYKEAVLKSYGPNAEDAVMYAAIR